VISDASEILDRLCGRTPSTCWPAVRRWRAWAPTTTRAPGVAVPGHAHPGGSPSGSRSRRRGPGSGLDRPARPQRPALATEPAHRPRSLRPQARARIGPRTVEAPAACLVWPWTALSSRP